MKFPFISVSNFWVNTLQNMFKTLILLFVTITQVLTCDDNDNIVPDVVDVFPQSEITVTYPSGKKVKCGKKMKLKDVIQEPSVEWEAETNKYYTLAMVDPDGQMTKSQQLKHWLIGNIIGNDITTGDEIATYANPKPPPNSGTHRYTFLVYEQPQKLIFTEPIAVEPSGINRMFFSAKRFAKKYNLGQPIAANYFTAKFGK